METPQMQIKSFDETVKENEALKEEMKSKNEKLNSLEKIVLKQRLNEAEGRNNVSYLESVCSH